jgi:hypothetical protein
MTATLVPALTHSTPALAGHLDTALAGLMILAPLNLAIIIFLGFYMSVTLKKTKHAPPRKNEPKNVTDLIKHDGQSVVQSRHQLHDVDACWIKKVKNPAM